MKTTTQAAEGRWGRVPSWWLDHPEIDADGLAVLAALSTYADARGECWPAQGTLAAALKRSRSTVNRIIGHLHDHGIIEVEARSSSNGGRLSCLYRLRQEPGDSPIVNTVRRRDTDVAGADSPCVAVRQEQPESNKPDSLEASGRGDVRDDLVEGRTAKPVPADWMPSATDLAWARSQYGEIDVAKHVEGFVLRCAAHGYRYRDVGAAWRAWLVQDAAARKAPLLSGMLTSTTKSRAADKMAASQQQVAVWAGVAERLRQRPAPTFPPSFRGGF